MEIELQTQNSVRILIEKDNLQLLVLFKADIIELR